MKETANETARRFSRMQWRMLFATMIGYTLFYFMRKNFSFAMPGLQQDCGISKSMLGNFLFWGGIVYGLSKFLNGIVGDKVNPRRMLCFGLLACTLVNVAFGFAPEIAARLGNGEQGTGNGSVALAWTFGILLVVNQFFQGTGFPPCAKLIAFWIPPKELATKMSVWNTSHSIGGGLVAKICGVIMGLGAIGAANQGVGMWRWCFWSMAALGFLGLVLMIFWLPGTPKEEGLPDLTGTEDGERIPRAKRVAEGDALAGVGTGNGEQGIGNGERIPRAKRVAEGDALAGVGIGNREQGIGNRERIPRAKRVAEGDALAGVGTGNGERGSAVKMVFLNPVIWMLGVANFTINAVRALIADWGPTMLQEAKGFNSSSTGTVIMLFEFAGIAGMLFAGWATDRFCGGRAPRLCVFLMALTAGLLAAFWFLPAGVAGAAALCLGGFCLYGPQALTGVTATNISTKRFAGTSIGFISLFSYVGASVAGKVCGNLAQSFGGWRLPLLVMVATAAVGATVFLCLWRTRANSYEADGVQQEE